MRLTDAYCFAIDTLRAGPVTVDKLNAALKLEQMLLEPFTSEQRAVYYNNQFAEPRLQLIARIERFELYRQEQLLVD